MSNVYSKLQSCRVELQKMNLSKSGKNSYSKYDYFELGDFLPKVNELFETHKLFSQFNMDKEKATLFIIDTENESNVIFSIPFEDLELKGANKVQALGGVNTYLKRYLYMNALEIVENDMFDGMKEKTPKQPKVEKPTQEVRYIGSEEKNQLREKIGGSEFAKVLNACGGKLTYEKFEELMQ